MSRRERLCARFEGDFVVFLIGMRINRLWKVHHWLPAVRAMPRMLGELQARPELGLLGAEMWTARTTIMLQYWRSLDQLLAYATDKQAKHLPAWKAFNQTVAASGDIGVWHETYLVSPGRYENIYVNMPAFGLGKVGSLVEASGSSHSASGRVAASGGPPP
jgi:hypothetical protein